MISQSRTATLIDLSLEISNGMSAHALLIHYEWLVNLEQLLGKGEFWFSGYPLKWLGGTGSPVRAIATL